MPGAVAALTEVVETRRVMNAIAAGTSDQTSTAVDLESHRGGNVRFVASFGTITASAVTAVKAQQRATSTGTWADVSGSEVAVAADDDNDLAIVDVVNPMRYVRCAVDRGTANAVIDGVIAEIYFARTAPAPQHSTVAAQSIVAAG